MNKQGMVRISLDEIVDGATSKFDICDDRGVLLLGHGRPLTETVREELLRRGVTCLEVHPEDLSALTGRGSKKAASQSYSSPASEPLHCRRILRRDEAYSPKRAQKFAKHLTESARCLTSLAEEITNLSPKLVAKMCEIPSILCDMALEDADQSIAAMGTSAPPDELTQRCIQMAVYSINSGLEMELTDKEVSQVGMAALIHDLGLYLLPDNMRDSSKPLSTEELWEFKQHPALTVDTFSRFSSVPDEVCVIAGQVHERPDGSGYPRGLHANLMHPLARVISIVDAYISLTSPGPGRPPVVPHDALAFLLFQGGRGLFDAKAMRAFLTQATLFPIGSKVRLDTGELAVVIRRDESFYATPVVKLPDRGDDQPVALRDSGHRIAQPVVDSSERQMRIPQDMMSELAMDSFQLC